jgi:hypothetical protein
MERLGLIAGNRKLPFLVAQTAKKNNYNVVALAVKGDTSFGLKRFVDKIYWVGLDEFGKMFEVFRKEEIKKVVMAGQISPHRLFSREIHKNKELKNLLSSLKDKRADTIFGAVAGKLKEAGFELVNCAAFLKDFMPGKGTLTGIEPDFALWEDIYFGLHLAKSIASLDIGQTVAVKDKAIVAVEALEGTDNLIWRSGKIAGSGISVVKVSKPNQDMRFDIPVVGLNTVKNLIKAHAKCLAIEAQKTVFIDRQESAELADKNGIAVVAV